MKIKDIWLAIQSKDYRDLLFFFKKHQDKTLDVLLKEEILKIRLEKREVITKQLQKTIPTYLKEYYQEARGLLTNNELNLIATKYRKKIATAYFEKNQFNKDFIPIIAFEYLQDLFPYATHGSLEKYLQSSEFFKNFNNKYKNEFINTYCESSKEVVDDIGFKKAIILYGLNFNKHIINLYLKNQQEVIERNKTSKEVTPEITVELFQESLPINIEETDTISYHLSVSNFCDKACEIINPYLPLKKHEKFKAYLLRIASKAMEKDVAPNINEILKFASKISGEIISNLKALENQLQQISLETGFQVSLDFIEQTREKILNEVNPAHQGNALEIKIQIAENASDEQIIEYFKSKGFIFDKESKFKKQMKSELGFTANWEKKRSKFINEINNNDIWQAQQGYFIYKFSFGSDQIRLVRNGRVIENILNHADYERIYGNIAFGKK